MSKENIPQEIIDKLIQKYIKVWYAGTPKEWKQELPGKDDAIFGYSLRDSEVQELKKEIKELTEEGVVNWRKTAVDYRQKLAAANKRIEELEEALNKIAFPKAVAYFSLVSYIKQIAQSALK